MRTTSDILLLPTAGVGADGAWPPPRPGRQAAGWLLAACNLLAVLTAAWSLTRPEPPPVAPILLPLPPPVAPPAAAPRSETPAPASPVVTAASPAPAEPPLAPGAGWTLDEALPRLQGRLEATGLEIRDLVDAVMGLRRDSALLAEDGQLAHERLQALEARLGQAHARKVRGPARPVPPAGSSPAPPESPTTAR
ncbi:hypothetical protein [Benzoatithermus flavus]|uniref:Uncharacterized protein n=1 Tax=Benzoatithermus flavus TaxID=3108223 RepID=A0ABU8Y1H8_9PROT